MNAESKKEYLRRYYLEKVKPLKPPRKIPKSKKELDALYRDRNRQAILLRSRQWNFENKEKARLAKSKWRKENPEKQRRAQLEWIANNKERHLENRRRHNAREKTKAAKREWALNHPSCQKDYYFRNREKLRTLSKERRVRDRAKLIVKRKKWVAENRWTIKVDQIKRDALKRKASLNLKGINRFVKLVKSKEFVICYYCQNETTSKGCHFDHIIPLIKGGLHSAANLCVACPACNLSKHAKSIPEWITEGQTLLNL